jgi:outer membrane immunogenic protein
MRLTVAFAALILAAPALAADYPGSPGPAPVLRGALPGVQSDTDWSGVYFGGSVGYSNATTKFNDGMLLDRVTGHSALIGTDPALSAALRNAASGVPNAFLFSGRNQSGVMNFGGFLGINYQSDDMVLGLEADYTRGRMKGDRSGTASGTIGPYLNVTGTANRTDSWTATTSSNVEVQDFGTIRARAGYAHGNFLPYVTAGIAWVRASHEQRTTVGGTFSETNFAPVPVTTTGAMVVNPSALRTGAKQKFHFGYALGAGVDVALSRNIFFRAEAIHSRISDVGETNVQINQVRASAGVKF